MLELLRIASGFYCESRPIFGGKAEVRTYYINTSRFSEARGKRDELVPVARYRS